MYICMRHVQEHPHMCVLTLTRMQHTTRAGAEVHRRALGCLCACVRSHTASHGHGSTVLCRCVSGWPLCTPILPHTHVCPTPRQLSPARLGITSLRRRRIPEIIPRGGGEGLPSCGSVTHPHPCTHQACSLTHLPPVAWGGAAPSQTQHAHSCSAKVQAQPSPPGLPGGTLPPAHAL